MKRRFVRMSSATLTGRLGLFTEGCRHNFTVRDGLPVDAEFVSADFDTNGDVRWWFEHRSFEESDPDELIVWCFSMPRKRA